MVPIDYVGRHAAERHRSPTKRLVAVWVVDSRSCSEHEEMTIVGFWNEIQCCRMARVSNPFQHLPQIAMALEFLKLSVHEAYRKLGLVPTFRDPGHRFRQLQEGPDAT